MKVSEFFFRNFFFNITIFEFYILHLYVYDIHDLNNVTEPKSALHANVSNFFTAPLYSERLYFKDICFITRRIFFLTKKNCNFWKNLLMLLRLFLFPNIFINWSIIIVTAPKSGKQPPHVGKKNKKKFARFCFFVESNFVFVFITLALFSKKKEKKKKLCIFANTVCFCRWSIMLFILNVYLHMFMYTL